MTSFNGIGFSQLTLPEGFTIFVGASGFGFAPNLTRYFGYALTAPSASVTQYIITIPRNCIIKSVVIEMQANGAAGTGEPWPLYIRVNNTTDHLINTVSVAGARRTWINNSFNLTLNALDVIIIKSVTPNFAVSPATVISSGYLVCQNR